MFRERAAVVAVRLLFLNVTLSLGVRESFKFGTPPSLLHLESDDKISKHPPYASHFFVIDDFFFFLTYLPYVTSQYAVYSFTGKGSFFNVTPIHIYTYICSVINSGI